ncbi:hypothetical protein EVAR_10083_1 [Eumeta japonica]|uniref:Uncharacterized protein n=1 Tax=Eumeta variegata TaxID=151549 RepID=A0A4C1TRK2_EUMVA|nr:hypothetical protein EVAR_10083_1 [Eumeta japonica]
MFVKIVKLQEDLESECALSYRRRAAAANTEYAGDRALVRAIRRSTRTSGEMSQETSAYVSGRREGGLGTATAPSVTVAKVSDGDNILDSAKEKAGKEHYLSSDISPEMS